MHFLYNEFNAKSGVPTGWETSKYAWPAARPPRLQTREYIYTDRRIPLSHVRSVVKVFSAQLAEVGVNERPPPLTLSILPLQDWRDIATCTLPFCPPSLLCPPSIFKGVESEPCLWINNLDMSHSPPPLPMLWPCMFALLKRRWEVPRTREL